MRKFLFALLLMASPLVAQQVPQYDTQWIAINPFDSIEVVVIPGRPYLGEYKPPAIYNKWWEEIMRCSKLRAPKKDIQSMRWYWVYGRYGFAADKTPILYAGWSSIWTREIYIQERRLLDQKLVMHEMLHFLIWENAIPIGYDGHPALYFETRCHVK